MTETCAETLLAGAEEELAAGSMLLLSARAREVVPLSALLRGRAIFALPPDPCPLEEEGQRAAATMGGHQRGRGADSKHKQQGGDQSVKAGGAIGRGGGRAEGTGHNAQAFGVCGGARCEESGGSCVLCSARHSQERPLREGRPLPQLLDILLARSIARGDALIEDAVQRS